MGCAAQLEDFFPSTPLYEAQTWLKTSGPEEALVKDQQTNI